MVKGLSLLVIFGIGVAAFGLDKETKLKVVPVVSDNQAQVAEEQVSSSLLAIRLHVSVPDRLQTSLGIDLTPPVDPLDEKLVSERRAPTPLIVPGADTSTPADPSYFTQQSDFSYSEQLRTGQTSVLDIPLIVDGGSGILKVSWTERSPEDPDYNRSLFSLSASWYDDASGETMEAHVDRFASRLLFENATGATEVSFLKNTNPGNESLWAWEHAQNHGMNHSATEDWFLGGCNIAHVSGSSPPTYRGTCSGWYDFERRQPDDIHRRTYTCHYEFVRAYGVSEVKQSRCVLNQLVLKQIIAPANSQKRNCSIREKCRLL